MLRHAAGYKLAGDGHDTRSIQDYLAHRNISAHYALHRDVADPVQGFLEEWLAESPLSIYNAKMKTRAR